ncbi:LamB/YcsF family protein [Planotetraspora sp. A-T 1434]|uniref:LamB/YcsF family protein n=1 Tax=Planotetraspora sp. A-T 1434 TaxID=2979219 RepID=UPI0021BFE0B0|nr:5-oxoprolinase subunit PxpA [Planotetraspora sp. A-T 1434]MCT9931114.1 LamB/YcsF family protein [Planotetraspora sp. A-T 1434]
MNTVDLNADLGEGFGIWRLGDDTALLDLVTSANVACGFHAGDPLIIRRTCAAAVDRGVAIGAQVSYRDLAGFGRREMDVDPEELCSEVLYQLAAVDGIARAMGGRVSYVKPHGAFYNRVCRDAVQAEALVAAVADYAPASGGERQAALPILTLPGSAVHRVAERYGVPTVNECFADRAYTPAGALVSRREAGAVLHDPDEVAARAVRMARDGVVTAVDGTEVRIDARSVCVHGDTPGAVRLAEAVRKALVGAGIALEPFA